MTQNVVEIVNLSWSLALISTPGLEIVNRDTNVPNLKENQLFAL